MGKNNHHSSEIASFYLNSSLKCCLGLGTVEDVQGLIGQGMGAPEWKGKVARAYPYSMLVNPGHKVKNSLLEKIASLLRKWIISNILFKRPPIHLFESLLTLIVFQKGGLLWLDLSWLIYTSHIFYAFFPILKRHTMLNSYIHKFKVYNLNYNVYV